MRVLHILNELKYSGAEIMYVDAATEFRKLGCELFVVNTSEYLGEYSSAFETAGYNVYHKPYNFSKFAIQGKSRWRNEMMSLIREKNIDIVHIHAARLRGVMSYVAWRAGVGCVYTFHNVFRSHSLFGYYYMRVQRIAMHHLFHCQQQTISDSVYLNEKVYWKNKTTLVYNWYGKQRFFPRTMEEYMKNRSELGITDDRLIIVSVGGCSNVKRHTDVVKALSILKTNGIHSLYLHLGEGISLDEEKQLAKELNVYENIRFLGNQRNVREYLVASDIYVMPSRYEGIPITTIEAMACKIPCVLYNVPGLRDFNNELDCCRLIEESPEKLAEAIVELYRNNDEKNRLIENAYTFISRHFDVEENAKKIFSIYEKIYDSIQ